MDYFKWKELDKAEEVQPFTPKQIKDELKLDTGDFTLEKGKFIYGFMKKQ